MTVMVELKSIKIHQFLSIKLRKLNFLFFLILSGIAEQHAFDELIFLYLEWPLINFN